MDDLFRETFADEQADVPAFVKSNIDERLGFHKKKTGWKWGTALLGLLLISAGVLWFSGDPEKTQLSVDQNTTQTTGNQPAETPSISAQNSNPTNTTDQILTIETNTEPVAASGLSSGSGMAETDASGGAVSNSSGTFQPTKNQRHTNPHSTSMSGKNETQPGGTSEQAGLSEQTATSEPTGADRSETTCTLAVTSTSTNATESSQNTSSTFDRSYKTPVNLAYRAQEKNDGQTALTITHGPVSTSNWFKTDSKTNIPDATLIERGEYYNPWMISATAGINFAQSKYTFQTNTEKIYYDNSTFMAPGFEGNMDVKYRLKNSLTFGTGAGISQLVENYNFFKESVDIDTTIVWQYQNVYQYDSLLDTTIFIGIDSTSTATYDSTKITLYNENGTTKATYLQIPFSIGTQIIRNKFRFDLFVMGRFNYLINGSGGYLQNDVFMAFTKTQNEIFKTWYIDLMIGGAVHYQLFEKLYLTGTFRFHPALGQLYEGLDFNRSIQSFHAGLGVSLKL